MDTPERIAAIATDLREEAARFASPTSLAAVMEQRAIPGVALAVVAEGRIEWAGGFGVRAAERRDPVTDRTLFQAGSISKPVAALCALRLVADGVLALDEDVNERLTSWRVPASGAWQPRVTLRQLLSHTAGLTVHGFPGYPRDAHAPDLVGVLDGRGNTAPVRVRTLPGLQFSYSGGGYCVLQQLLVDVAGERFPELARRLVLEPLGMQASTYEQPLPERLWATAATGHRTGARPVDGRWHVYPEMAAAGLWTTAADLARFVLALQRTHEGAAGAILPAQLAEELLTPQATNAPMGLGVLVDGDGSTRRFRHGGDDQGFVAWMTGYVEQGLGAVVMTNSDSGMWVIGPLLEAVARAYDWPDFSEAREPQLREATEPAAEACAGTYQSVDGDRFSLERDGHRLVLRFDGQPPIGLAAASATEWHALALAVSLTFELDPAGRAQKALLHQDAEYVRDLELTRLG
jgi:CubicO group peptidase (beta-lactamase class C family)